MNILDILNQPWAIEPGKLEQIVSAWHAHVRGEKIDISALEAQLGRPLAREQQGYEVRDDVAIVPIDGVIAQKANLFSRISGGASSQLVERDIRGALADGRVRGIVLEINSPGGTVHGTQELADLVDRARAEKPIAVFATGQMASAAYWIGAAADKLFISGDNVFTGSIGIVATHVDRSKAEEQMGVKTTEIVAGKYKRVASEYAPLGKEGRAHMQEFVDYLYSVFVNDVAAYRGVSTERVLSDMADGRVFIGRQAIEAGLVDGVSTLDDVVAQLQRGQMARRAPTRKQAFVHVPSGGAPAGDAQAGAGHDAKAGGVPVAASEQAEPIPGGVPVAEAQQAQDQPSIQPGATMNREELKAAHPELLEAILAEGRTEGASAERARIKAVEAQALPGHGELIAALKYDGKTTGDQAASQVLMAERKKLGGKAADLAADAAAVAAAAPSAGTQGAPAKTGDDPKPEPIIGSITEEQAKAEWDKDAKVRAEFGGRFADYFAVRKAEVAGRDKVLGKKAA